MTPARRAHIARVVTFLDQHRGRTVAPIREGGPFDGRTELKQDEPMTFTELCLLHLRLRDASDAAHIAMHKEGPIRDHYINEARAAMQGAMALCRVEKQEAAE